MGRPAEGRGDDREHGVRLRRLEDWRDVAHIVGDPVKANGGEALLQRGAEIVGLRMDDQNRRNRMAGRGWRIEVGHRLSREMIGAGLRTMPQTAPSFGTILNSDKYSQD